MFEDLQKSVVAWGCDRDLIKNENAEKQFMKFIEEVFEFKAEMDSAKSSHIDGCCVGYLDDDDDVDYDWVSLKLELGDILVTLIILSEQMDIDLVECLAMAYEKISDRKGKTINGVFVKEEDL